MVQQYLQTFYLQTLYPGFLVVGGAPHPMIFLETLPPIKVDTPPLKNEAPPHRKIKLPSRK